MMKFLHLEIQTDYLEKNINKTWTFQKPIKLLLEQEPSGATFRQFGISQALSNVGIFGWEPLHLQSLQKYDLKTTDSYKNETLNSL